MNCLALHWWWASQKVLFQGSMTVYCGTAKVTHTFNIDSIRVLTKPPVAMHERIVAKSGKRYQPNPKGTPVDDVWDIQS